MTLMVAGYGVLLAAALRVAWVDCRRLRIEYETLACAAVACGCLRVAGDGPAGAGLAAGFALAGTGIVACAVRLGLLRRPGDGDWPLLAVCLFLGADEVLVFATVLGIAGLCMSALWSLRRRKPLFRSRFPLAPPALLAAVTAFVVRHDMSGGSW